MLCKWVRKDEIYDILRAFHDEPDGGHYLEKNTIHKILGARYYWTTLHKDVKRYVWKCHSYQRMRKPSPYTNMTLHPQVVLEVFKNLGLDFISPMNQPHMVKNLFYFPLIMLPSGLRLMLLYLLENKILHTFSMK